MKRKGIIFFMVLVVCAGTLFAAPSDKEVGDTLMGVVATHFSTSLQAAMGAIDPNHLTIKKNADKGTVTYIYKNYPVKEMNNRLKAAGKKGIPFTHLSGKIIVKGPMLSESEVKDYTYDVTFKGGKVRSLYYRIKASASKKDDASITMKVNGRKYSEAEMKRFHESYQKEMEKAENEMPIF